MKWCTKYCEMLIYVYIYALIHREAVRVPDREHVRYLTWHEGVKSGWVLKLGGFSNAPKHQNYSMNGLAVKPPCLFMINDGYLYIHFWYEAQYILSYRGHITESISHSAAKSLPPWTLHWLKLETQRHLKYIFNHYVSIIYHWNRAMVSRASIQYLREHVKHDHNGWTCQEQIIILCILSHEFQQNTKAKHFRKLLQLEEFCCVLATL